MQQKPYKLTLNVPFDVLENQNVLNGAGFLSGLELFEIFSKEHENIVLWNEKLKKILTEDHSKTVLKITY